MAVRVDGQAERLRSDLLVPRRTGTVRQDDQPPVLATAKLPTGVFAGLSSTTSTRPLTPPAAPEGTRAPNRLDPEPKLLTGYSR